MKMKEDSGSSASIISGSSKPEDTANAVVDAIEYDIGEQLINFPPMRLTLLLMFSHARAWDWLVYWFPGMFGFQQKLANARGKQ
jgi:hypothetical protein